MLNVLMVLRYAISRVFDTRGLQASGNCSDSTDEIWYKCWPSRLALSSVLGPGAIKRIVVWEHFAWPLALGHRVPIMVKL